MDMAMAMAIGLRRSRVLLCDVGGIARAGVGWGTGAKVLGCIFIVVVCFLVVLGTLLDFICFRLL